MNPQCSAAAAAPRTFVRVLAGELCNGISNLCADRSVGLVGQALQQLGAYGFSLSGIERQEQVGGLTGRRLARLGRLAPEDDGGKGSRLRAAGKRQSQAAGERGEVLLRYPGPVQSARKGPSRALRASGRPIRRSAAARLPCAGHYQATGGPAAAWPAPCEPLRVVQT